MYASLQPHIYVLISKADKKVLENQTPVREIKVPFSPGEAKMPKPLLRVLAITLYCIGNQTVWSISNTIPAYTLS
jgi:hypothetical protein